jgi:NADH dehydrogenase FAD-containing subunit
VARVGRWAFGGLPAWLLWHGYYLTRIPSWRNRLRLATGWALSGIVGRDTGQLDLGTGGKATREAAS